MTQISAYLVSLVLLVGFTANTYAFTFADIKDQIITQTKVTIHKSGGIAGFYDASEGDNTALKQGVLDHVLTNRFVTLDLGWYSGDNDEGIIVGGPGIILNSMFSTLSPDIAAIVEGFVPPLVKNLDIGVNAGWGTDSGRAHYGVHILYNFGG